MGAMHRPSAGDEPALKASDLACEADLAGYVASHRRASVESSRGAYARRRHWLAWAWGCSHEAATERLRPAARAHALAGASKADAWAYASKQAVAALACVRPPRLETASERQTREARAIADKARVAA